MANDKDGIVQREKELRREVGFSPAVAGAAAYQGLPILARHALEEVPHGLSNLVLKGRPISSKAGTPLRRIAEFSRKEITAIQNFARESRVTVPIEAAPHLGMGGVYQDPHTPLSKLQRGVGKLFNKGLRTAPHAIGLGTSSVPIAMHEIGHAAPILGSTRLRRLMHDVAGNMGSGGLAGNLARMAIASNVLAPPDEDASRGRKFLYDNAPALVGATMVPELVEEGRASVRARRGARRHGPGTLRALKDLAPAFSTYAGAAVGPVIATLLAKKLVDALHRRAEKHEKERPVKLGAAEEKASGRLRNSVSSAGWLGTSFAQPQSTKPNTNPAGRADETPKAPAVNNGPYWKDQAKSLMDPQRGFRLATPG